MRGEGDGKLRLKGEGMPSLLLIALLHTLGIPTVNQDGSTGFKADRINICDG